MKGYIDCDESVAHSKEVDEQIATGEDVTKTVVRHGIFSRPARPTIFTAVYWWKGGKEGGYGDSKGCWTALESEHLTAQAAYDDAAATPELIDVESIKIYELGFSD